MKRLEKLKFEREVLKHLTLLPFSAKGTVDKYYEREITAIEQYGSDNPDVSYESLSEIEKIMEEVYGNQKAK